VDLSLFEAARLAKRASPAAPAPVETRSLESPAIPLSAPEIIKVLGGPTVYAGKAVSESSAVNFIPVYRCISLIAGTIAQMPLRPFRGDPREPVRSSLIEAPHRDLPDFELWELVVCHLLSNGNAYLAIERDGGGAPVFLDPIPPLRVAPEKVVPTEFNPQGKRFRVRLDNGEEKILTPYDLLHVPGLGFDGIRGLSPIGVARQAVGSGLAMEEFSARYWAQGATISGVLQTEAEVTKDQAEALKARWKELVTGTEHAHEVAVLGWGTKFEPIQFSNEDSEFLASREFQASEIGRLYGVPAHMLGLHEKDTAWGSGLEEQVLGFVQFTCGAFMRRIERRVSTLLPRGQRVEFLAEMVMRGRTQDRYAVYEKAKAIGLMTIDEMRRLENLPPLTDEQKAELAPPAPPAPPTTMPPRLEMVPNA
jgi:HK97 family phage portal protein